MGFDHRRDAYNQGSLQDKGRLQCETAVSPPTAAGIFSEKYLRVLWCLFYTFFPLPSLIDFYGGVQWACDVLRSHFQLKPWFYTPPGCSIVGALSQRGFSAGFPKRKTQNKPAPKSIFTWASAISIGEPLTDIALFARKTHCM
ncbi:hypothetical protein GDO78_018943 [Eleutherodactylus coqui]|uniref:Uncharacterized protein n=1 Tax=Eleutherodactylus coqui TaxID=57060 RepID=A0A8J6ECJ6_ELECQ|nr:hypothetical protein GDO78_018943 [Eleutherodactylus coqui]